MMEAMAIAGRHREGSGKSGIFIVRASATAPAASQRIRRASA